MIGQGCPWGSPQEGAALQRRKRGRYRWGPNSIQPANCHPPGPACFGAVALPTTTNQSGMWPSASPQVRLQWEARESNVWGGPSPQINHGQTFLKGMKADRLVLAHCPTSVCNEETGAGDSR